MSARTHSGCFGAGGPADIAELVERNLAKVEVAGSSPVVRSEVHALTERRKALAEVWDRNGGVAERRGNGLQIRVHGFKSRLHLDEHHERAIGAAVARFPDTEEVTGSIPVSPTTQYPYSAVVFVVFSWGMFKKRPPGPYCDPQ